MKREKRIFIIVLAVIAVFLSVYLIFIPSNKAKTNYIFGNVTRGTINVLISSTGTLEATSTVDVGTQVSGKIAKLCVDFNSEVKKGQLLAIIDTVTLVAQVRDAQASLAKARAEYKQKVTIHEKNKILYAKKYISELDFIQSQTDVESTLASLNSAEYAVDRAKTNLDYAYIYAPIAGKIINRAVEQGQTVAASLSTPTLFTIAEDISSMRILASVDESDIGQIKEGQKVKFTVQSYSNKSFEGYVTQIRLKSNSSSSVVIYTVVIHAPNANKLLLPGMTATVDFYVDHRDNVLLVQNSALKFKPSDELMAEVKNNMEADFANIPDSVKNKFKNQPPPPEIKNESKDANSMAKVFYIDRNGKYRVSQVKTGLNDGKYAEIVDSRELQEGIKVITGSNESTTEQPKKTNSIMNQSQQNGPPPPMM